MADTTTSNYGLTKPEPGASSDTWGGKLNDDLDAIDAALKAVSDVAGGALQAASNLSDLPDKAAARDHLGVEIGADVQAYHGLLTALAGLTIADGSLIYGNGAGSFAVTGLTAAARGLLDDTSASAMRTTLGVAIGADVQAYNATLASLGSASANGVSLVTAANYAAMAGLLGLSVGSNVQGYDPLLASIAGLTFGAGSYIYGAGADTAAVGTMTAFIRTLLDDADEAAARATLGLIIGTHVQAYHALLASIAGGGIAANEILVGAGANTVSRQPCTAAGLALLGGADAAAQRTTLGLGSAALKNTGGSGDAIPKCDTANSFSQAQSLPAGSTYNGLRMAHVASGSAAASGRISWGTGAPGSLAEGEIYLRHA